jgi:hypothetical protein
MSINKKYLREHAAEHAAFSRWSRRRQLNEVLGTVLLGAGLLGAGALAYKGARGATKWGRSTQRELDPTNRHYAQPGTLAHQRALDRAKDKATARAVGITATGTESKIGTFADALRPRGTKVKDPITGALRVDPDRGKTRQKLRQGLEKFAGKFDRIKKDSSGRVISRKPSLVSKVISGVGGVAGNLAANFMRNKALELQQHLFKAGTPLSKITAGPKPRSFAGLTPDETRAANANLRRQLGGLGFAEFLHQGKR